MDPTTGGEFWQLRGCQLLNMQFAPRSQLSVTVFTSMVVNRPVIFMLFSLPVSIFSARAHVKYFYKISKQNQNNGISKPPHKLDIHQFPYFGQYTFQNLALLLSSGQTTKFQKILARSEDLTALLLKKARLLKSVLLNFQKPHAHIPDDFIQRNICLCSR